MVLRVSSQHVDLFELLGLVRVMVNKHVFESPIKSAWTFDVKILSINNIGHRCEAVRTKKEME